MTGDLDEMRRQVADLKVAAWKSYTGMPPGDPRRPWNIDDEKVTYPMLETARKFRITNISDETLRLRTVHARAEGLDSRAERGAPLRRRPRGGAEPGATGLRDCPRNCRTNSVAQAAVASVI